MVAQGRKFVTFSVSFLSFVAISCGSKNVQQTSDVNTVVGRGGAFFDQRVQVINALPNYKDRTTCLYSTEFKRGESPAFNNQGALSTEQSQFLQKAEREAKPVTMYPVSIDALDRGLSEKDNLRKLRGSLLIPLGIGSSLYGATWIGLLLSPCGPGAMICGNMTIAQLLKVPWAYGLLGTVLGGFGLLNQAFRDLNSKNSSVRHNHAVANSAQAPQSTNLGVTLAFANVAKSLPAASNRACPADLSAESIQPFLSMVDTEFSSLSESDRVKRADAGLDKLKSSQGCYFAAEHAGENFIYKAYPLNDESTQLHLQTYRINPNLGATLIADEELQLQLKSDANAGRKFIVENERGSLAIWLDAENGSGSVAAKIAHKLPSGEYVNGKSHVAGTCRSK